MQKKNFILKIIIILIIQALFVTQVDFSLASVQSDRDFIPRALLQAEKVQTTFTSLVKGISSLFTSYQVDPMNFKELQVCGSWGGVSEINKGIYKLFIAPESFDIGSGKIAQGVIKENGVSKSSTKQQYVNKRGPPSSSKKMNLLLNRTA